MSVSNHVSNLGRGCQRIAMGILTGVKEKSIGLWNLLCRCRKRQGHEVHLDADRVQQPNLGQVIDELGEMPAANREEGREVSSHLRRLLELESGQELPIHELAELFRRGGEPAEPQRQIEPHHEQLLRNIESLEGLIREVYSELNLTINRAHGVLEGNLGREGVTQIQEQIRKMRQWLNSTIPETKNRLQEASQENEGEILYHLRDLLESGQNLLDTVRPFAREAESSSEESDPLSSEHSDLSSIAEARGLDHQEVEQPVEARGLNHQQAVEQPAEARGVGKTINKKRIFSFIGVAIAIAAIAAIAFFAASSPFGIAGMGVLAIIAIVLTIYAIKNKHAPRLDL